MSSIFQNLFMAVVLTTGLLVYDLSPAADVGIEEKSVQGPVIQLEIEGPIGPATSDYIEHSIDYAAESGAQAVLLRIDTPGGLDTSMRQIIKKIIASPVPVISYVAPGGARAASAGTYILYASHIAAMAPGTNLGAATPIQIIGQGTPDQDKSGDSESASEKDAVSDQSLKDPMSKKMVNDAAAYIHALAKMRGRNVDWAEKAVRLAASISAEEALELNVIDLIAVNERDLLERIEGRKVNVLGQDIQMKTRDAILEHRKPDWRTELLAVITNPNIAYILMLIGIYGLILEFYNPGSILPGTLGGICLIVALFAFQLLPVNYAGMALIILGVALMIAEAFVPSIGVLGVGGVAAFVIGSVILMDTDAPGFGINIAIVGGFALSSAAFFIFALSMLLKARRYPVVSGKEDMIGKTGIAMEDFTITGMIRVHSELWRAHTDSALLKNEKVTVKGIDGLTLLITPARNEEHQ